MKKETKYNSFSVSFSNMKVYQGSYLNQSTYVAITFEPETGRLSA